MGDGVMVFAPAPLLTVTIEQQAGAVELHLHAGGQGVWQARMISSLGASVTLCVTVGGEVGDVLRKLLDDEDVAVRAVRRDASTGWYIHDRRDSNRTEVAQDPGPPLVRHDIDELYGLALTEGLRASVSVLSGPVEQSVVDPDIYRRLAADLTANNCTVVADLSGPLLEAVLEGGVSFVKVSHENLIDDGRAADDSVDTLVDAGHRLQADGAAAVLISRAEQPALAFFDDQVVEIHVPQLQVADHRGAGDSMTAGVVTVLARGGSIEDAVRTGAAAGALNVTRRGLGTGSAEAVQELIGHVQVKRL
jgi:1-phosphofructokinase